jgi:hypothetical protein
MQSFKLLFTCLFIGLCGVSESQAENCPNGGVFKCPVKITCEQQPDVRWDATVKTVDSVAIFEAARAFADHKCAFSVVSIHTDLMHCTPSCE